MKLAYVTSSFPSATETFVLREVNYLSEHFQKGHFCVLSYVKPASGWFNRDNLQWLDETTYLKYSFFNNLVSMFFFLILRPRACITILKMTVREVLKLSILDFQKCLVHIIAGFGMARLVRKESINHLHAHFSTASTLALIANVLTGVSFSFTAHASGDIYCYSEFLYEKIKKAKRIIAISEYNKKCLWSISGYEMDSDRVTVIRNGVRIPEKQQSSDNIVPVIFTSAAFTSFKGYGTLMGALKILKKKMVPFKFICCGNGPYFEKIQQIALGEGLRDDVTFLGMQPLSVVENYLAKSDVFLFPSETAMNGQRDGMPTAITEAMAYGLPIIATIISSIPEQVLNGQNGYLVHERDEVGLAEKLEVVLSDSKLRISMGMESRRIATEKFNEDHTLAQLLDLFDSLHSN